MIDEEAENRVLFAIMDAYLEDDEESFVRLCAENQAVVLACFANWTRVPEALRHSEQATRAYIDSIVQIARLMQQLGHDGPMTQLAGRGENPIDRWQRDFAAAHGRAQEGEHAESNRILEACLQEMEGARGSALDMLRPKMLGMLGSNFLYLGDFEQARRHTQSALTDCERIGDRDGIRAYRENLDILRAIEATRDASKAGSGLLEVRSGIARAQDLSDLCLYSASSDLLNELLARLGGAGDERLKQYRTKVLGLLGTNAFKTGRLDSAERHTRAALEICTETGDFDGIRIYQANLDTVAEAANPRQAHSSAMRDGAS